MSKEMTIKAAALRLDIKISTLYRLIYSSKISARKKEGRWLLPIEVVEARREFLRKTREA